MARDRVVYGTVISNAIGGIKAEIEGAIYGPGVPSLDPDLQAGDCVPVGFLSPRSSRQPLMISPRPRLIELPFPLRKIILGLWPQGQAGPGLTMMGLSKLRPWAPDAPNTLGTRLVTGPDVSGASGGIVIPAVWVSTSNPPLGIVAYQAGNDVRIAWLWQKKTPGYPTYRLVLDSWSMLEVMLGTAVGPKWSLELGALYPKPVNTTWAGSPPNNYNLHRGLSWGHLFWDETNQLLVVLGFGSDNLRKTIWAVNTSGELTCSLQTPYFLHQSSYSNLVVVKGWWSNLVTNWYTGFGDATPDPGREQPSTDITIYKIDKKVIPNTITLAATKDVSILLPGCDIGFSSPSNSMGWDSYYSLTGPEGRWPINLADNTLSIWLGGCVQLPTDVVNRNLGHVRISRDQIMHDHSGAAFGYAALPILPFGFAREHKVRVSALKLSDLEAKWSVDWSYTPQVTLDMTSIDAWSTYISNQMAGNLDYDAVTSAGVIVYGSWWDENNAGFCTRPWTGGVDLDQPNSPSMRYGQILWDRVKGYSALNGAPMFFSIDGNDYNDIGEYSPHPIAYNYSGFADQDAISYAPGQSVKLGYYTIGNHAAYYKPSLDPVWEELSYFVVHDYEFELDHIDTFSEYYDGFIGFTTAGELSATDLEYHFDTETLLWYATGEGNVPSEQFDPNAFWFQLWPNVGPMSIKGRTIDDVTTTWPKYDVFSPGKPRLFPLPITYPLVASRYDASKKGSDLTTLAQPTDPASFAAPFGYYGNTEMHMRDPVGGVMCIDSLGTTWGAHLIQEVRIEGQAIVIPASFESVLSDPITWHVYGDAHKVCLGHWGEEGIVYPAGIWTTETLDDWWDRVVANELYGYTSTFFAETIPVGEEDSASYKRHIKDLGTFLEYSWGANIEVKMQGKPIILGRSILWAIERDGTATQVDVSLEFTYKVPLPPAGATFAESSLTRPYLGQIYGITPLPVAVPKPVPPAYPANGYGVVLLSRDIVTGFYNDAGSLPAIPYIAVEVRDYKIKTLLQTIPLMPTTEGIYPGSGSIRRRYQNRYTEPSYPGYALTTGVANCMHNWVGARGCLDLDGNPWVVFGIRVKDIGVSPNQDRVIFTRLVFDKQQTDPRVPTVTTWNLLNGAGDYAASSFDTMLFAGSGSSHISEIFLSDVGFEAPTYPTW